MPRVIVMPDRKRVAKEPEREVDERQFYEKEIEANRQVELPVDVSGYSKKAPMPRPTGGNNPRMGTGNARLRDEWNYGVTYYLP